MKRNPALKSVPIKPKHVRSVPSKLLDFPLIAQKTTFTCGPAVVSAVAKYYKHRVSEGRARMMMDTCEKYGTKPENMRDYLRYLRMYPHMHTYATLSSIRYYVSHGHPVIVLWNDWRGHWAIVIGVEGEHLILADPANAKSGMRVHKTKNFRRHWHAKVAGKSYKRLMIRCDCNAPRKL